MKNAFCLLPFFFFLSCEQMSVESVEPKPVYGIDVSNHQGDICWEKVKEDTICVSFAYVKASEGTTWTDKMFEKNMKGASMVGIPVGAYHFFRMTSPASTQYKNFRRQLMKVKFDLIPVIDVETYDGKTAAELKQSVSEFVSLFVKDFGYYPIIYGPEIAPDYMCPSEVSDSCLFFIGKPGSSAPRLRGRQPVLWQFEDRGKISGIKTGVDIELLMNGFGIDTLFVSSRLK